MTDEQVGSEKQRINLSEHARLIIRQDLRLFARYNISECDEAGPIPHLTSFVNRIVQTYWNCL